MEQNPQNEVALTQLEEDIYAIKLKKRELMDEMNTIRNRVNRNTLELRQCLKNSKWQARTATNKSYWKRKMKNTIKEITQVAGADKITHRELKSEVKTLVDQEKVLLHTVDIMEAIVLS